jgi:predicted  nucleic acid-binding Zn-ribbon protein
MESAMANNDSAAVANASSSIANHSPTVVLFQKAHAKMVTIQRIDEQLQNLVEQRRKLQDELRGVQALINEEFDRVMQKQAQQHEVTSKLIPQFNADVRPVISSKRNGTKDTIRLEVAEAV